LLDEVSNQKLGALHEEKKSQKIKGTFLYTYRLYNKFISLSANATYTLSSQ
jgi:hypothetical protein